MPENSGTGEIAKFYGMAPGAYYGTGMAGSPGTAALESPPLMSVGIVPVYQSSQGDLDRVTVDVGDTFSSSSDSAAVASPLLPGAGPGASYATDTGAGHGHSLAETGQ
jgi:hypothetical protein